MNLNLAHTLRRSAANGPGERFVIWVQGCRLACHGCWNPDTWSFAKRNVRQVADLVDDIISTTGLEGVTFTGGEPFEQASALAAVGRPVRERGLSVFVFTGYKIDELVTGHHRELLAVTDVLVAGRYEEAHRTTDVPWLGSTNQEVHFLTSRYSASDMLFAPPAEVRIGKDGTLLFTGFPSVSLLESARVGNAHLEGRRDPQS